MTWTPPPQQHQALLAKLKQCLVVRGTRYQNKIQLGMLDHCSTLHTWVILFIEYLILKDGLECLYTCDLVTNMLQKDEYYNYFVNFVNQHCDDCENALPINQP
jgi:hypothetical protein